MIRSLIAVMLTLTLALPTFAQGPSTVIVNQGHFNVNKVVNVGAPQFHPMYSGYSGYPMYSGFPSQPSSTFIQNFGSGNVNVVRNLGFGGAGSQNVIVNQGHGNFNKIINR